MGAFGMGQETPAEQLLRMIEGPPEVAGAPRLPGGRSWGRVWSGLRGIWTRCVKWVMPIERRADPFLWSVRLSNRFLWIMLIGLGAYTLRDFTRGGPKPSPELVGLSDRLASGDTQVQSVPSVDAAAQSLPQYLAAFASRNPFTGSAFVQQQGQPAAKQTVKNRLEELAAGVTVVGIDRGPTPVALIEDVGQQRTHFVKVGDSINGLLVKEISPQGVIVSYEGEEMALH